MTFTKLVTTRRCDNQPDPEPHFYRNNAPFAIENEQKQIFTDASDLSTFCVSADAYESAGTPAGKTTNQKLFDQIVNKPEHCLH